MTNPDAQRPNLSKAPPQNGQPPNPYGTPPDYAAYPPPLTYPTPPTYPTPQPVVNYPAANYPTYPTYPTYNAYGVNPYGYAPIPPRQNNGIATAAMTTGIVSGLLLLMSFVFLFFSVPFSFLGGIAAIILGFIGMRQTKRNGQNGYGMALTGVITGAVNVLITVVVVLIVVAVVAANN